MTFKKEVIQRIVKATGVQAGEIILLHFWGDDEERHLLHAFSTEVAAFGATPFELQQSRKVNYEIFMNAKEDCFGERYFRIFEQIDAVIDIFMYQPVVLDEKLDEEHMNIYRNYMRNLFPALMKAKRFIQLRVPTTANAMGTSLEPEPFKQRMMEAYDIDYEQLKKDCEGKIERIRNSHSVVIKTGQSCELSLSFENREWMIDAGDGDMPCGEIYIAPVEGSANGYLFYDKLYIEENGVFENIRIEVKDGRLIDSDHEDFNRFLRELPENGDVLCEFGIGMNQRVTELVGYSVLDEKMAGTFHIAIGDNTMFHGKNQAPIHIDMVGKGELLFHA